MGRVVCLLVLIVLYQSKHQQSLYHNTYHTSVHNTKHIDILYPNPNQQTTRQIQKTILLKSRIPEYQKIIAKQTLPVVHHKQTLPLKHKTGQINHNKIDNNTKKDKDVMDISWKDIKKIIQTIVLVIIILIILYFVLGIIFKLVKRHIIKLYATSPESLMKSRTLSLIQKVAFEDLQFDEIKQVEVILIKDPNGLGMYHRMQFGQTRNVIKAQRSLKNLTEMSFEDKEIYYFEIEIEEILVKDLEVIIGLTSAADYQEDVHPGDNPCSFGFSTSGKMMIERTQKYMYPPTQLYGQTLGIAIQVTKSPNATNSYRIFVVRNGLLLNKPPSKEWDKILKDREKNKAKDEKKDDKKDDKKEKEKEQEPQVIGKRNILKAQEDKKLEAQVCYLMTNKDLYPVISTNGKCTINFNVGAYPFRILDERLKEGLL